MTVKVKKQAITNGYRYQIEIDNRKIDLWYAPYRMSKASAYRKGVRITGETEIFSNLPTDTASSPTNETMDSLASETQHPIL